VTLPELYALTEQSTEVDLDVDAALARVLESETIKVESSRLREDNLSNLTLVERILDRYPAIELIPAMQGTIGLELAREQ
jgi:hypothetical protein